MLFRIQANALLVVIFCSFWHIGLANKKLTENYISTYKDIAISEMKRSGIPASIKLAQGILESDIGRSPLANLANNHFGIKCGKDWGGEVFYKLDDDTDSTGTLIESCFRAFGSAEESYTAHSEFLMNPAKASRYGFLFDLSTTDYVGWANGLKFAGYASDPAYPQKLIKIIENNKLYLFDENIKLEKREYAANDNSKGNQSNDKGPVKVSYDVHASSGKKAEPQIVKADQKTNRTNQKQRDTISDVTKDKDRAKTKAKYGQINELPIVYASGNESVKGIAQRTGKNVFDILEYNEELKSPDYIPNANEIVFLEKKKKNIHSDGPTTHIVNDGETMYVISQRYGIRLESLLAKNNLHKDAVPIRGETISLVSHLSKKDTPRHKLVERFDSYVDLGGLK